MTATDIGQVKPTIRYLVDWWFKFKTAGYEMVIPAAKEAQYLDYQEEFFLIRPQWLAKLTGTSKLVTLLNDASERKLSVDETVKFIEAQWQPGVDSYLQLREKYKLYP